MRITSLLVAGVAAIAISSAASAADLIIDEEPGIVIEDNPVGNWDGPYIGVFGGWGLGLADMIPPNGEGGPCDGEGIPDGEFGCDVIMDGFVLGVTAGANFTVTDGLVAGIAGDIAWTDMSGSDVFPFPVDESTNRVNFEGSIRGVLGIDAGMFMPYLTAGLAVANATHHSDFADPFVDTVNRTHVGGTAGVGVAVAVAENVALDFQYRASVYGPQDYDHETPVDPPTFALVTQRFTAGINLSF
jgi:outer membrane immunogenic protein